MRSVTINEFFGNPYQESGMYVHMIHYTQAPCIVIRAMPGIVCIRETIDELSLPLLST